MYKIVVCDLDETLLRRQDSLVCQKNIDAIYKLKDVGVKFVVATGRGYTSVQSTLKEIGLYDQENEYTISFNGGVITENKNNKVIFRKSFDYELAKTIFEKGLNYDVGIHVYTEDKVYGYNIPKYDKDYIIKKNIEILDFEKEDFINFKDKPIIKMIYVNTNFAYFKSIEDEIKASINGIDLSYSANRYMEFNPAGVNKGVGMSKLAEILNFDIKDTIAIGDNFNDLPMIQIAGLGVGVSNSIESMKPYFDYITKTNCDEGAVSEVIDKFIFNLL